MAVAVAPFTGFRPEAVQFLADLTANNDRAWFQPRKTEYESLLKEPLEALVAALDERFRTRGVPLKADPVRSPFRIYRDVRFAKDKSPYKTNIGATFPWIGEGSDPTDASDPAEGGADDAAAGTSGGGGTARRSLRSRTANVHSSGGYFHLSPGEIYVGGGIWRPEKPWLDAFRQRIARDASELHEIVDNPAFQSVFGGVGSDGHVLQRVPSGFPPDHPEAELLKLKDVVFGRRLSDDEAGSPSLPDLIAETFVVATPLLRYLATVA
jgi:uncharacterized protein (DUF2461 family)